MKVAALPLKLNISLNSLNWPDTRKLLRRMWFISSRHKAQQQSPRPALR